MKKKTLRKYDYKAGNLLVNTILVRELVESNQLNELAHFLYLKSITRNSCIYNYTQVRLSMMTDLSRSSIRKYVKFFLDKGWCEIKNGHLFFKKLKAIDTNRQKIISYVEISPNIKTLKDNLYKTLLQLKQKQFRTIQRLALEYKESSNYSKIKGIASIMLRFKINPDNLPRKGDTLKISFETIAKLLHCKKTTAFCIIDRLRRRGEIMCNTGYKNYIRTINYNHASTLLECANRDGVSMFYKNGFVVEVECNSYAF